MFKWREPHCPGSTKPSFGQKARPSFLQPPPHTAGQFLNAGITSHTWARADFSAAHPAFSSLMRQMWRMLPGAGKATVITVREIRDRQGSWAHPVKRPKVPRMKVSLTLRHTDNNSSLELVTRLCQQLYRCLLPSNNSHHLWSRQRDPHQWGNWGSEAA